MEVLASDRPLWNPQQAEVDYYSNSLVSNSLVSDSRILYKGCLALGAATAGKIYETRENELVEVYRQTLSEHYDFVVNKEHTVLRKNEKILRDNDYFHFHLVDKRSAALKSAAEIKFYQVSEGKVIDPHTLEMGHRLNKQNTDGISFTDFFDTCVDYVKQLNTMSDTKIKNIICDAGQPEVVHWSVNKGQFLFENKESSEQYDQVMCTYKKHTLETISQFLQKEPNTLVSIKQALQSQETDSGKEAHIKKKQLELLAMCHDEATDFQTEQLQTISFSHLQRLHMTIGVFYAAAYTKFLQEMSPESSQEYMVFNDLQSDESEYSHTIEANRPFYVQEFVVDGQTYIICPDPYYAEKESKKRGIYITSSDRYKDWINENITYGSDRPISLEESSIRFNFTRSIE